jgi:hypothetical protein
VFAAFLNLNVAMPYDLRLTNHVPPWLAVVNLPIIVLCFISLGIPNRPVAVNWLLISIGLIEGIIGKPCASRFPGAYLIVVISSLVAHLVLRVVVRRCWGAPETKK